MSISAIQRIQPRLIDGVQDIELQPIRPSISSASTIQPASASASSSASSLRPQLAAPRHYYMWDLMKIIQRMEGIVKEEGKNCDVDTKQSLDRLLSIDRERILALQKTSKEIASKKSWSDWQVIAQYVATASSIVIGISISTAAPVAGALLISAGALGLLNRAVSDSGGWEWLASRITASHDLQLKIRDGIENSLTYLSIMLAIGGAAFAYSTGAMAIAEARDVFLNRALQTTLTIGTAMQAFIRLGIGYQDRKIMILKAEMKERESANFDVRQEIRSDTARFRNLIELSEEISERVRSVISSIPT